MENKKENARLPKRITMLIRRIKHQEEEIKSLNDRNHQLALELNSTKEALSNLQQANNKLVSNDYKKTLQLSKSQDYLKMFKNTFRSNILKAIDSVGTTSELLINLEKEISNPTYTFISNDQTLNNLTTTVSSPRYPSQSNRNQEGKCNESKKYQAAVNPMVSGYVLGHPVIALERLELSPNEVSVALRGTTQENVSSRGLLSPIQEEPTLTEVIRTRLGTRDREHNTTVLQGIVQENSGSRCLLSPLVEERVLLEEVKSRLGTRDREQNTQHPGTSSSFNNFIPDAYSEPVVRLKDVSRLLKNTSWINLNIDQSLQGSLENSPSPPSSSLINADNITSTITIRQRKKPPKKLSLKETITNNESDCEDNGSEFRNENTSFEQLPSSSSTRYSLTTEKGCDKGNINIKVEEDSSLVVTNQSPSQSGMGRVSESSCDRSMKKNTATLVEESTVELQSTSITKSKRKGPKTGKHTMKKSKTSSCLSITSTLDTSSIGNKVKPKESVLSLRASTRAKKPIHYVDEPLTSEEMNKILRKGRKKLIKKFNQ